MTQMTQILATGNGEAISDRLEPKDSGTYQRNHESNGKETFDGENKRSLNIAPQADESNWIMDLGSENSGITSEKSYMENSQAKLVLPGVTGTTPGGLPELKGGMSSMADTKKLSNGVKGQAAGQNVGAIGTNDMMKGVMDDLDDDDDGEFFEPLSYKKLVHVITTYHPVDPESKKSFSVKDRITVKDYGAKMSDACFCYALCQQFSKLKRFIRKKLKGESEKQVFKKPDSMIDLPDSGSSSDSNEEDEGARGLTMTSQCLGDGATLYLQSMKTLAIMFIVLTILNVPIYFFYQSTTLYNNFKDFNQVFKYFTLGNLGRSNNICGYSDLNQALFDSMQDGGFTTPPKIELTCEKGYMQKIKRFGLLYKDDMSTGLPSNGISQCHAVEYPLDPPLKIQNTTEYKLNQQSTQPGRRLETSTDLQGRIDSDDDDVDQTIGSNQSSTNQTHSNTTSSNSTDSTDSAAPNNTAPTITEPAEANVTIFFDNFLDRSAVFNIKPSTKISELKDLILASDLIEPKDVDLLALFYKDKLLDYNKTLKDYNISNNEKIHEQHTLYYEDIFGNLSSLYVEADDTIKKVKTKIMKINNSTNNIDDLFIYLNYTFLQNDETVYDYDIAQGDMIHQEYRLFFKDLNGTEFEITFHINDTVADIKNWLVSDGLIMNQTTDVFLEDTDLSLEYDKLLMTHKIKQYDTIEEQIMLNVIRQDKSILKLHVNNQTTIADVKKTITSKINLSLDEEMLTLNGTLLNDTNTIGGLGIVYGGQVQLNTRIVVDMLLYDDLVIYIPDSNTTHDLKKMILEAIINISPFTVQSDILLKYKGVYMNDDKTIQEIGVKMNDTVIQVIPENTDCKNECIDNGYYYCVNKQFDDTTGKCCSDASCIENQDDFYCTNRLKADTPSNFKYILCPNTDNCGKNQTVITPAYLTNGQEIQVSIDGYTDTYDFCSYWIKGPKEMLKNDKLWIQIEEVKDALVTLYIGQRTFTYLANSTVLPIEGMGHSVDKTESIFIFIERDKSLKNKTDLAQVKFKSFVQIGPKEMKEELYRDFKLLKQNVTTYNIDSECNLNNIWKNDDDLVTFQAYFKNSCENQTSCTIDPDDPKLKLKDRISEYCKDRIQYLNISSVDYILVAGCSEDTVVDPIFSSKVHKEKIGIIVVVLDIISVAFMAFMFEKLKEINDEYIDIMDDLSVQMKDFGIKVNNCPLDRYTQDSRIQKMKIWLHFKELLQEYATEDNPMEVIDVTLSLYTQPSIQCVFRMQEVQVEINDIKNNIFAGMYTEKEYSQKNEELKVLMEKMKRLTFKYKEITKKQNKSSEVKTQRLPKSQRNRVIQYVFVTFKNCETKNQVLELYERDSNLQIIVKKIFCIKDKTTRKQKLFLDRELIVDPIIEPDEILWENLAFTGDEQTIRKIIMQIISIIFLIITTLLTMYLSGLKSYVKQEIPDLACPEEPVKRMAAYRDLALGDTGKSGLMDCYCAQSTSIYRFWEIFIKTFQTEQQTLIDQGLLKQDVSKDNKRYCLIYFILKYVKQGVFLVVSTSAVLINGLISNIFKQLGQYQKKHTKIEEQSSSFRQIFLMEFTNMGIIVLISSFDRWGITDRLMGGIVASKEYYTDFNSDWYMQIGKSICVFLFTSSFLSNIADLRNYGIIVMKRFKDRSFKMNLKQDPEDEDDDVPNSKIKIQADLEKLYTGKEFQGEKAYSRMMSTLFVIQMYSSGMPVMYAIGAVFYACTYLVNKLLLIKYYQKSRTLTRTIPLFSMQFLKYGLLLHMFNACFMLTNPEIFQTMNPDSDRISVPFDPEESVEDMQKIVDQYGGVNSDAQSFLTAFLNRFKLFHQQLYLALLVAFFIFFIAGKTLYQIISMLFQAILRLIKFILNKIKESLNKAADEAKKQAGKLDFRRKKSESQDSGAESGERQLGVWQNTISQTLDKAEEEEREKQAKRRRLMKRMERFDYSENILVEMNTINLSNFYERAKTEIDDFWELFRFEKQIDDVLLNDELAEVPHPQRTVFQEICFLNRVTGKQVKIYQDELLNRIKSIEEIIDRHFNLIKPTLIENFKKGFEKERKRKQKAGITQSLSQQLEEKEQEEAQLQSYIHRLDNPQTFSYTKKMKLLIQHEEDLIKNDKARQDNRRGVQEICRMTGSLSQSYFIFDSQQFKVARKIYFGLDDESDGNDEDQLNDILGSKGEDGTPTPEAIQSPPENEEKQETPHQEKK